MTAQTLSPNTQYNTMGICNHASGYTTTDGAGTAAGITYTLGFAPRIIRFINVTDRIADEWFLGMTSGNSVHTVANGTVTLETSHGITVSGNTFTVDSTTAPNSKSFAWEAIG